jgi:hypothetical protein
MKKLILLLLVVAACSSEDPQPKNYNSLLGEWKFTAANVSGTFVIGLDAFDDEVIKSGTFKTDGHSHSVDFEVGIDVDGNGPGTVTLTFIDDDGDNLSFTNSTYSSDHKEMHSDGYFYTDGGNYVEVTEDVTVRRKN